MIAAVSAQLPPEPEHGRGTLKIMDIGAGDGRVLKAFGEARPSAALYSIEQSLTLAQAQPPGIVPVGTDFHEQDLTALPVDVVFCNPPYSAFEQWAVAIIGTAHARTAFLVIPRRWEDSKPIREALERRGATARVIHEDDFLDGPRQARAKIHIVRVDFAREYRRGHDVPVDPFDLWFDEHVGSFDVDPEETAESTDAELARRLEGAGVAGLVEAYQADYAILERNYRQVFTLDRAILNELGVDKAAVRDGLKLKMAGLKSRYWKLAFDRLDTLTKRLASRTRGRFLEKLTGNVAVSFTASNVYMVVFWALRNANAYYDEQLVTLFRDLSTFDGAMNYASNTRTWARGEWRHRAEDHDRYALDYRVVLEKHDAIGGGQFSGYDHPGGLHTRCHELIDDVLAVLFNLGYDASDPTPEGEGPRTCPVFRRGSRNREWEAGGWQDWGDGDGMLFQVKAHKNGNLHFRFRAEAMRRLNVEAGRLLGWLGSAEEAARETGCSAEEAEAAFGSSVRIGPGGLKLLEAVEREAA